jgi:hypothetical protein
MVDPFGAVLTLIRSDTAVAAIASTRVRNAVKDGDLPPLVVLVDNATSRRPFGPGSGRIGMQLWVGFARCYGPDTDTGAITARQLAGAVSDALHGLRPTTVGSRYIARAYSPDIDGMDRDPETHWPYYTVRIEAYAAA